MNILFEDNDIIVCEKPAGVASQSERGFEADMVSLLMTREREKGIESPYIGVVHRLDKAVGGVMAYAKTKAAAAELSKQIAEHKVKKKYYAVVCGIPEEKQGNMVDYLVRDGRTNISKVSGKGQKDAKRAELNYRVLESVCVKNPLGEETEYSLVDIELLTGRHHQIRVQFASRGLPLFGDRKYNQDCSVIMRNQGIGLFSYFLGFTHPVTKKTVEYSFRPDGGIFSELFYG